MFRMSPSTRSPSSLAETHGSAKQRPMQIDVPHRALPSDERQIAGRRRQSLIPNRHHRNDKKILTAPIMGRGFPPREAACPREPRRRTRTSGAARRDRIRRTRQKPRQGDHGCARRQRRCRRASPEPRPRARPMPWLAPTTTLTWPARIRRSACRAARSGERRARAGRRPAPVCDPPRKLLSPRSKKTGLTTAVRRCPGSSSTGNPAAVPRAGRQLAGNARTLRTSAGS